MTVAFVLGNGVSRKVVSIPAIQELGKIYGCNALHREFTPEVLVATDKPISAYIQKLGYAKENRFYTRRPFPDMGAKQVPQEYFGYSSGPIAVSIAAKDKNRRIYLVGFDIGPANHNSFNNVYADTEFYRQSTSTPTFTGNWIKQLVKIIKDNPMIRFYRICGETTATIPELEGLPNLEHQSMASFLDRINTKKEL